MKILSVLPTKNSITTHLIIVITMLIFMIIGLLTVITTFNTVNILKENANRELSQMLKQSATKLSNFIELHKTNLDLWSSQPIVDVFFSNPELSVLSTPGLHAFFSEIKAKDPSIETIFFIDNGKITFDYSNQFKHFSKLPVYKDFMRYFDNTGSMCFVFEFVKSHISNQLFLFIGHQFIKNGDPVPGKFLVLSINLETIQQLLFNEIKIGKNGFIALLAQSYKHIWLPNLIKDKIEVKNFLQAGKYWHTWKDIPDSYQSIGLSIFPLAGYQLAIAGIVSNHEIHKTVYVHILTSILTGIIVLLIGIVVSFWLSKRITKPLIDLTEKLQYIELDNLESFKINLNRSICTEVEILNKTFLNMIQKLTLSKKILHEKNTALMQMEHSLRMQRNRLYTTLSCIGDGVITTDKTSKITFLNSVAEYILGCDLSQAIGKPLEDVFYIINEQTRAKVENPVDKVIKSGKTVGLANHTILINKKGMEIPIDDSGAPIKDNEGHLFGVVLVFRDVSKRRKDEKELKQSEERFRILFEKNPTSFWLLDFSNIKEEFDELKKSGVADIETYFQDYPNKIFKLANSIKILNVNQSTLILHNAETKEALSKGVAKIVSPELSQAFYESLVEFWNGSTQIKKQTLVKTVDGKVRHVMMSCNVVPGYEQTFAQILIAVNDITERQNLEEQLHQAQKMESIGQLAGGVAHDYNNMLSVIIGYTEICLQMLKPGDMLHEELMEILVAGKRSADITRQLLAFARQQPISPQVLDLNKRIENTLKMLRRLIGEHIELDFFPNFDLWLVNMDPAQIDQILANLCVNARDAIADIGKITIETGKITFDAAYCEEHLGFIEGDFVMLAVSDNGCGMDKETANKIFEPFFTTKKLGQGTGLGLATVYGIVKQNKGFINVYTEPGRGTIFKIYIPKHEGKVLEDNVSNLDNIPSGFGETILVVEDEPSILRLAETMLTKLGYRVLAFKKPLDVLELSKEEFDNVSLLLTDVVMPEMNGRQLCEHLKSIYPQIKCLFMSGYISNVIASKGTLEKGGNFLQKPFSKKELAIMVRKILDDKLNGIHGHQQ